MLHDLLASYIAKFERVVRACDRAQFDHYVVESLSPDRVKIRARIRFTSAHFLSLNELIFVEDGQIVTLNYRYHFQDESNRLVFRYDCAPHHRSVASFPHHKHTPLGVFPSAKPDIGQVVLEAAAASQSGSGLSTST